MHYFWVHLTQITFPALYMSCFKFVDLISKHSLWVRHHPLMLHYASPLLQKQNSAFLKQFFWFSYDTFPLLHFTTEPKHIKKYIKMPHSSTKSLKTLPGNIKIKATTLKNMQDWSQWGSCNVCYPTFNKYHLTLIFISATSTRPSD